MGEYGEAGRGDSGIGSAPTLKAAIYHGPGDVRIEQAPAPQPAPGEILVRVATAGICGSDLGEFTHDPIFVPLGERHPNSGHVGPMILGHEFSGWVEAVGPGVEGFGEGALVAVGAGISCDRCPPCRRGNTNLCETYWTVGLHGNGGLAEMAVVPASCVLDVTDAGIAADLAAMAQPMAIAIHAVRRAGVWPGDNVVVLGVGGIGTFITVAATRLGAEVTAVDVDPARLGVAAALGAVSTIEVEPGSDPLEIAAPDITFECSARPESLTRALAMVRGNGTVVVVGHQPEPVVTEFKLVSLGELDVLGTQAHVFADDFPAAVAMIAEDPAPWRTMAPEVFPLDQVVPALESMASGTASQSKLLFDPAISETRPLRTMRAAADR